MPESRRRPLQTVSAREAEHPGLWLDKYLSRQMVKGEQVPSDKATPQQQLVDEVAAIGEAPVYSMYYQRWREALCALPNAKLLEARVQGRMAVGLGGDGVLETAITLHHTYGLPYIPGSALKGMASSYAHQRLENEDWREGGDAYDILFGTQKEAGFVVFHDALYVPRSGRSGHALHPDIITVHHPDYYQQGDAAPADWDSPTPISFLSATGRYLIALSGPAANWVKAAGDILKLALEEAGAGAKTSSGYGRLVVTTGDGKAVKTQGAVLQEAAPPEYERGTVKKWIFRGTSSFGFIISDKRDELYVHETMLGEGLTALKQGQSVWFKRVRAKKGIQAHDVHLSN